MFPENSFLSWQIMLYLEYFAAILWSVLVVVLVNQLGKHLSFSKNSQYALQTIVLIWAIANVMATILGIISVFTSGK